MNAVTNPPTASIGTSRGTSTSRAPTAPADMSASGCIRTSGSLGTGPTSCRPSSGSSSCATTRYRCPGATPSRSGRTACGPSACARRRWSTGAWASRPSACGWTSPATPTGARSASVYPSGSTSSGRPRRPSTTTRTPMRLAPLTTSTPGSCTASCSSAGSASRSMGGASGTTRGVTATGGSGVGTGRRSRSGTASRPTSSRPTRWKAGGDTSGTMPRACGRSST